MGIEGPLHGITFDLETDLLDTFLRRKEDYFVENLKGTSPAQF